MKTTQVLDVLKVVTWIIFIGLCIRTGVMLISFLVSLFINHAGAKDLYMGMDLSQLLAASKVHYIAFGFLIIILSGLKAYLFFWVVKIFSRINIAQPFSEYTAKLISRISGIALQIGITSVIVNGYAKWLMKSQAHLAYSGGETEFLFLAGILFVIAQIFNRGIELQRENELTI